MRKAKKSAVKAKKPLAAKKNLKKKNLKMVGASKVKKKVRVSAIPKGYHAVTPYLIVDNAAKAIEFYQNVFGAKLGLKMDGPAGKIAHSELKIGDSRIMVADEFPESHAISPKTIGGSGCSIHLYVRNVDKVFEKATAAGAKVLRPLENAYYGDRCALLEDQFGHKWHVATHIEDVSNREIKKRAQAFQKSAG